MLEVHRWRQMEWSPSAVVALATSVNGTDVAAARENGAIELWKVAPGSVGWHCHLSFPGKENAVISSLIWCKSSDEDVNPLGRLFSAGLDGFITEWDLQTLRPKGVVESYGGSVWQLAAEPVVRPVHSDENGNRRLTIGAADSSDSDENSEVGDSDSDEVADVVPEAAEQRVAVGCDDGCVRLFTVGDSREGMVYRRCFPRVKGRILSVAWSTDGSRIYSGGSDGCIRGWDSIKIRELFRITAGIGGGGGGSELCVWSLLALRDGTIVSGDSTGSTQFWEGKDGILLQAHAMHAADVLALAASPSHGSVYAAGADGQVVLYQHVGDGGRAAVASAAGSADLNVGPLTDKWVFVGSKRTHTHDVRAVAVAVPMIDEEGYVAETKGEKRVRRKDHHKSSSDHRKRIEPGTAMLISGGSDAKLFTYSAKAFLAFHPHDICPAPQRPHVQLASDIGTGGETVFMAQHPTWVDVWRMHTNNSRVVDMEEGLKLNERLGKRKGREEGDHSSRKSVKLKGSLTREKSTGMHLGNGKKEMLETSDNVTELARAKGIAPGLVARIKCKTAEHISCSAISGNGRYVAFSDRLKPRLYHLDQQELGNLNSKKVKGITRKKLPESLPAAQSVQFTSDSTRLLLGCPDQIMVIELENTNILHSFHVAASMLAGEVATVSPINFICTSSDSQWLAATRSCGDIHVFNLETLRHHWSVPILDGSVVTSAVFRPSSSNVLIVSTASNQIHVLNVEGKDISEWSKVNGIRMARELLEFPGPIIGLSVPSTSTSTSVIAYSSRAMCRIDFSRPLSDSAGKGNELDLREDETSGRSAETDMPGAKKNYVYANGNGVGHRLHSHYGDSNVNSNFVVVNFKDTVLFLGHITPSSVLIVEKPWLEVLRQFQPPVFRHLYGT